MTLKLLTFTTLAGTALFSLSATADFQRGYVSMMGSSTVVPFVKAVADKVSHSGQIKAPLIQASGTGGGIKLFCEGMGAESPDIAIASRDMKPKEKDECQKNGIGEILELKIGYDGLILAQSKKSEPWSLTSKEARLAFAKWLAKSDGSMELNPNKNWHDVKESLPESPIEVLGPPTTSATHDAFIDLIAELECKTLPWVPAGAHEPTADMLRKCRSVREDRVYQEGRENDLGHIGLVANATPPKIGVFGYRMMSENGDKIRAIPINGVEPTYANISTHAYIGARPLYLYVKAANIRKTPGLKEFLGEITSDAAWGDKGYLRNEGLIAMPASERAIYAAKASALGATSVAATPSSTSAKPSKGSTKSAAKTKHK
jgi:phosphate transport system substrate-binding protein